MTIRNAATMPASLSQWEARGYHGNGNVQGVLGSIEGRTAIICGNAAGVFAQLQVALQHEREPVIFACNDVGQYLLMKDGDLPLHHWVSLHADNLGPWRMVRGLNCRNATPTAYHSVDRRPGLDYIWDQLTPCFALSGYFAMQLAWIMGAARIVLCGIPGSAAPRFFEAMPRPDFTYGDHGMQTQLIKEMSRVPGFKDAVRSISGEFTESYFGRP